MSPETQQLTSKALSLIEQSRYRMGTSRFVEAFIDQWAYLQTGLYPAKVNRPGFPGECFICELRLPDHRFRWKHNKLFLLLPEEYGPAFPAIVDCYTSPPT